MLKTLEQRVTERTQELQESEAQLRQLATTDALTGLANRRRFDDVFATTWRQAQRERLSVSVLMIDADHFKAYNDCYGHEAGDDCLRAISGAIEQRALRAGDFAARYGGEEFMVLLANTDTEGALTVAQRIHAAMDEPLHDRFYIGMIGSPQSALCPAAFFKNGPLAAPTIPPSHPNHHNFAPLRAQRSAEFASSGQQEFLPRSVNLRYL